MTETVDDHSPGSYRNLLFIDGTGRRSAQSAFLRSVSEGFTEVFTLGPPHFLRMAELIERYGDLPMDMADASLVVLAEQLGHGRILTVDRRDFNVYRWNDRNLFENQLIR